MLYRLINTRRSPLTRRLLAAGILTLFPLIVLISIFVGTVWNLVEGLKYLYLDFKALIVELVPETFRDLVRVLKTGGNA